MWLRMSGGFRRQGGFSDVHVGMELRRCASRGIQISSGCASTFRLATCLTGARQVRLVRAVWTGCRRAERVRRPPPYEALYRRWREQGDCVLGDITRSPGQCAGGFASYRLDHDYELFGGAREEDTGMKEMRNIADRGRQTP